MSSTPSFTAGQSASDRYAVLRAYAASMDTACSRLVCTVVNFNATVSANPCGVHLPYSSLKLDSALREVPDSLLAEMVHLVGLALSSTGTPIAIDLQPYRELYFGRQKLRDTEPFSCVDVVERLWAEYASRGEAISLSQAAHRFASTFGLRGKVPGALVAGCVVLVCGTHVDHTWEPARYGYSARDRIRAHLAALVECLPLVDPSLSASQLQSEVEAFTAEMDDHHWAPSAGVRRQVGGIAIRPYQTSVKYHVPQALAQALNLFAAEHAAEYFLAA
jgi:hypothetical protein